MLLIECVPVRWQWIWRGSWTNYQSVSESRSDNSLCYQHFKDECMFISYEILLHFPLNILVCFTIIWLSLGHFYILSCSVSLRLRLTKTLSISCAFEYHSLMCENLHKRFKIISSFPLINSSTVPFYCKMISRELHKTFLMWQIRSDCRSSSLLLKRNRQSWLSTKWPCIDPMLSSPLRDQEVRKPETETGRSSFAI